MAGMHGMSGSMVLGGFLFLLVMLFAYPALLMVITRPVVRFRPGYWRCFAVVLLSGVIAGIVGYVLRGATGTMAMRGIGLVLDFILITVFLRAFVKHPDDAPLDWSKAALSAVIYVVIVGIISFGISAGVHHLQATGALPAPPHTAHH